MVDRRTGLVAGRGLRIGDKLYGEFTPYLRPVLIPASTHVSYWRRKTGFASWPTVDHPRSPNIPPLKPSGTILWALLVHQPAPHVQTILSRWKRMGIAEADLLLLHGGSRNDFEALQFAHKTHVTDPRLQTSNHPTERQSYRGVLRAVADHVAKTEHEFVLMAEYDQVPLASNWGENLISLLMKEGADVLFHHLTRVDGTSAPHYLHHLNDLNFAAGPWKTISIREDKETVLNALGTGSFWSRQALIATSQTEPGTPVYLEMDLPTTAHHLGFRVRDFCDQNQFVGITPFSEPDLPHLASQGAWSAHPVK